MIPERRRPTASYALVAAVAASALLAGAAVTWSKGRLAVRAPATPRFDRRQPAARSVLRVPHAAAPIVLDGDNDDPGWLASPGPARTGPFVSAAGVAARPHSEARMAWGDGHLYVLLYAADEDVRSRGDAFRMTFSRGGGTPATYAITVSADGSVNDEARDVRDATGRGNAPWRSGTHVSREIDGTLDDPRDVDEEWSLETAVPLASLGMKGEPGERIGFAVERCDAPDRDARGCGGWGVSDREPGELVIVIE